MRFDAPSFKSTLIQSINQLLQHNQVNQHGYVRMQIYRSGAGAYTPVLHQPYFLIEANSLKDDPFQTAASYRILPYRDLLLHYDALSPYKTGNALPYVLAGIFAQEQGFDDAVLFQGEWVADTAGANLFIVRQQKIFTPPIESGCLDGIMRRQIFAVCKELKIPCAEKKLKHKDLVQADEIFLTNSVRGIIPVQQYDQYQFLGEGAISAFLRNCLIQFIEKQLKG